MQLLAIQDVHESLYFEMVPATKVLSCGRVEQGVTDFPDNRLGGYLKVISKLPVGHCNSGRGTALSPQLVASGVV